MVVVTLFAAGSGLDRVLDIGNIDAIAIGGLPVRNHLEIRRAS
jgi:hypothetical protein